MTTKEPSGRRDRDRAASIMSDHSVTEVVTFKISISSTVDVKLQI